MDQLYDLYSRENADHTGPHSRPDLAIRGLLPGSKQVDMLDARMATAEMFNRQLRQVVFTLDPALEIDAINFVSPNAAATVRQIGTEVPALKNNSTINLPPVSSGYPIVQWYPVGDSVYIHFKNSPLLGVNSPIFYFPILETQDFYLKYTDENTGDENEINVQMVVQFIVQDYDPTTLCFNNRPWDNQTATTNADGSQFKDSFPTGPQQIDFSFTPNNGVISTQTNNPLNLPGAEQMGNVVQDILQDRLGFGAVFGLGPRSTTQLSIERLPYFYGVDSNGNEDISISQQVLWTSPYNTSHNFIGGIITVTPQSTIPDGRKVAMSTITDFDSSNGVFTFDPPLPWVPHFVTKTETVYDMMDNPYTINVPDYANTDTVEVQFPWKAIAIKLFAWRGEPFAFNMTDQRNFRITTGPFSFNFKTVLIPIG
jgi:hypothetical protein